MENYLSSKILLLILATFLFSCSSWKKEVREKLKNPDYILYGENSRWEVRVVDKFIGILGFDEKNSDILESTLRGGSGSLVYEHDDSTLSIYKKKCFHPTRKKLYPYSGILIKNRKTYNACGKKVKP